MINTELRKKAKNDFEKNFYKLMNNSVFGKTMENVRERMDIEIVVDEKRYEKVCNASTFIRSTIFGEDVEGCHKSMTKIQLNKPIYCGQAILDLSKIPMYEMHYDVMKKRYGDKLIKLKTDTDSLTYQIFTEDLYQDMLEMKDLFDFSDYPKNHPCYDIANKKVLGKFKDESNSQIMTMCVGLRSKVYAERIQGEDDDKKRCKGVKKAIVASTLNVADYVNALLNDTILMRSMTTLRSYNHEVFTQKLNKIALSSADDKRFVLQDKISTRAHGHYKNKLDEVFIDLMQRVSIS